MTTRVPPLRIAHVIYRFDVGGLENGVVNLVNRLPAERFRHVIVALTEVTNYRRRIERDDVEFVSLHKPPGQGARAWPALYRAFRALRPDIVHTRNLAALEASLPAWLAGVRSRVHGEHGWDVVDLDGSNPRHRLARRLYRPFVTRYVALSRHIEQYLVEAVGVAPERIAQIYNGVDTARFAPRGAKRVPLEGWPFDAAAWTAGTIGRLADVKDQAALIRAMAIASSRTEVARQRMRAVIVGDGPMLASLRELARSEGMAERVWFTGGRDDVDRMLAQLDAFALPSLAEGISNTLLEAMSCGLPVIATAVGGNVELVQPDVSGTLIPPGDPGVLADALLRYLSDPELAWRHGQAARAAVEAHYSLDRMVADYAALYEQTARHRAGGDVATLGETRRYPTGAGS